MTRRQGSRRAFLAHGSTALLVAAWSHSSSLAAAAERVRAKISDVQTLTLQGESRTYVLVRIVTADGQWGVGEAYGSPGVGIVEQIEALKPWLIGRDPLEIDRIYTLLGEGQPGLAGTRTDGSAHTLMRAASGIEMALWDLAGKLLNTPVSILLGGRFRDHVRVYDHSCPRDMFDKGSCREWSAQVRAHPSGFTAHKIDIPRARDRADRHLTSQELARIAQGFANVREAIGWDHDLMVHCHWDLDLPSAIQLARAIADIKPLWLEDPLPVDYSESWKRLAESSPVPILTGENLARREGFAPFLVNAACHIVNPDLRNSGGLLETKRIADMAAVYGIPVALHNTGSQLHTYQACQWAASIRDFMLCETITGEGGWMDEVIRLEGRYIDKGCIRVSDRPGTGVELNRDIVKAHLAPGQKWWGD